MFDYTKFRNRNLYIRWLESKGDTKFDYYDNGNCCLAQWARECGAKDIWISGSNDYAPSVIDGKRPYIPNEWFDAVSGAFSNRFAYVLVNMLDNVSEPV